MLRVVLVVVRGFARVRALLPLAVEVARRADLSLGPILVGGRRQVQFLRLMTRFPAARAGVTLGVTLE